MDRQEIDCAEQARRATQDFAKYFTGPGFGLPSTVTGSTNHYNRKLGKCIVDVQTMDKNGTVEFVLNAYEQSDIIWCMIRFSTNKANAAIRTTCMDHENKAVDPAEANKEIDALMRD